MYRTVQPQRTAPYSTPPIEKRPVDSVEANFALGPLQGVTASARFAPTCKRSPWLSLCTHLPAILHGQATVHLRTLVPSACKCSMLADTMQLEQLLTTAGAAACCTHALPMLLPPFHMTPRTHCYCTSLPVTDHDLVLSVPLRATGCSSCLRAAFGALQIAHAMPSCLTFMIHPCSNVCLPHLTALVACDTASKLDDIRLQQAALAFANCCMMSLAPLSASAQNYTFAR
jgi:hypothetical protein